MNDFYLEQVGQNAVVAKKALRRIDTVKKNEVLTKLAGNLIEHQQSIIDANEIDMIKGREHGMPDSLLDRLKLDEKRITSMAEGLLEVVALEDPIGSMDEVVKRPNGLQIGKQRVPLGVIGIIYEARPNVTTDAFGLCFKSGNVSILRGGSDAKNSNAAIAKVIRATLSECNVDENAMQLLEDTDHESLKKFMQMKEYVDLLIPRGGAGLIRSVVENASIPVIETGTGNCHVYVDESADISMAVNIIMNAKTQRIGVCNACESILVHENIKEQLLPELKRALDTKNVEVRGDATVLRVFDAHGLTQLAKEATEEDWGREYLDYILSAKTVSSLDEAIDHINKYNTGHSEAIVTNNYENSMRFLNEVDAAAVYVNASTRFTDGHEFGFGAEIGISTQKLHARGPMGLSALTTTKYVVFGNGQVRP